MAAAAVKKQTPEDNSQTEAPKPRFSFAPKVGVTIPENVTPARSNELVDEFFTPALHTIMTDDNAAECFAFFPVAYFQMKSDEWAAQAPGTRKAKALTTSDARQKVNDTFKKFQEKNSKASLLEIVMVNATGKEGIEGIDEPGIRTWVRMAKK